MPDDVDELDELGDLDDLGDLGDLDLDDLGEDGEATGSGGGKRKKLIIIAAAALLLIAGGGYFFMGSGSDTTTAEESSEGDEDEEGDEDDAEPKSTPYYFSLDPAFVVNFVGRGNARFLQVNVEGLTRDASIKEEITLHLPHIRNNIVMLLSSKTYDELITPEGKENLRKEVLAEVRKILRKETGKDGIEDVYFTSFVMQ